MAEELTGRIVEWNGEKAYGYLRAGKKRFFLHIRDFSERHKRPAVGDRIRFQSGSDEKGRSCAVQAVHVNDGGRFGISNWIGLTLLLVVPAVAWCCLPLPVQWFIGAAYGIASLIAWFLYAGDKRIARANGSGESPPRSRVPEIQLHLVEFLGGWPGAFIAQRRLRHKSSKRSYQLPYWLIVAFHELVALDFLCDWRLTRLIFG